MAIPNPFQWQFAHHGFAIIDGALATELQHRGCDLNDPLWSAKVLIEQPELIVDVHEDYFAAGADCAITASYQATPQGFAQRGLSQAESISLIKQSVDLAKEAKSRYLQRTQRQKPLVIAGSVGPYGAFLADGSEYTGNYHLEHADMKAFHVDRIQALVEAGADILACETMPSFDEIKALVEVIQQFPAMPAWFSFTLKDSAHLSDGTPLKTVMDYLNSIEQVLFVGVNCIALDRASEALATLKTLTTKPLIVYPNSGEHYDPKTKTWSIPPNHAHTFCNQLPIWQENGAKLIGGCCRTTPEDIKKMREHLIKK